MHRFFIDGSEIVKGHVQITGEDAHHIQKVLRLRQGDDLVLCDGAGWDYQAVLESMDKHALLCRVLDKSPSQGEPKVHVTLYQGLPKGAKMELIIQKCVELGIYALVPIATERAVVKLDQRDSERKTVRWQRIAEEAAKQSARGLIPEIYPAMEFKKACSEDTSAVKLLLWEGEREHSLRSVLSSQGKVDTISVLIGPEGGLTQEETEYAAGHGFLSVTVGPRVLRTETAGFAVLSAILYAMEEMEWTRP